MPLVYVESHNQLFVSPLAPNYLKERARRLRAKRLAESKKVPPNEKYDYTYALGKRAPASEKLDHDFTQ